MDKIQIIEKLFSYILESSYLLIPLCFFFSKVKNKALPITLLFYGVAFFFFLHFYYDIPKDFRKIEQTVYTLLEYLFFSYIIWLITDNKKTRRLIFWLSILFLSFEIYYFLTSGPQRIDSIPVGIETILILFYSILYFINFFKENTQNYIYNDSSFWMIVGILLYLGSSFFFNILANHLSDEINDNYWYLTFIPEIIKNILLSIGIIIYKGDSKDSLAKKPSTVPYLDMI